MHKLVFYPLGNADCCCISLACGKKILFDYANTYDQNDTYDLRCDLEKELRDDLESVDRDYYDVVAFTHLDEDHYKRSSEFFWFDHAKKYQSENRIKIKTLWVPAAAITETGLDNVEAKIIQKEAKYRFREGKGIRIFSRPDKLKDWCKNNEIDFDERKHLITDAGNVTPEFSFDLDGVEFFVQSPFAKRLNDSEVENRNADAIIMHVTFMVDRVRTKVWLMADATHEIISEIFDITKARGRHERLEWDIIKLPHHCSYLSLSPNKGEDKTRPVQQVKELFENYKQYRGIVISSSKPIPIKNSDEDKDNNPPHRQAAEYYKKDVVGDPDELFKVTMEHPNKTAPKPLIIEIDCSKATIIKRAGLAGAGVYSNKTPRAGKNVK